MVEEIAAENGSFLAISYEMALGKEVSDEDWNESLYEKWGECYSRSFLYKVRVLLLF